MNMGCFLLFVRAHRFWFLLCFSLNIACIEAHEKGSERALRLDGLGGFIMTATHRTRSVSFFYLISNDCFKDTTTVRNKLHRSKVRENKEDLLQHW